jgi:hypothetical protein
MPARSSNSSSRHALLAMYPGSDAIPQVGLDDQIPKAYSSLLSLVHFHVPIHVSHRNISIIPLESYNPLLLYRVSQKMHNHTSTRQ